jgi:hypothetical protein
MGVCIFVPMLGPVFFKRFHHKMQDIKIKVNFLSNSPFFFNFQFSKIIFKNSPHLDSGFSLVAFLLLFLKIILTGSKNLSSFSAKSVLGR